MSRGAVAIKAKGVLAVRRRVAASPLRGGLNQPAGDHRGRGKIRTKLPDEAASEVLAHVHPVRDAPIPGAARPATDLFINTYAGSTRRSVVEGGRRTTVIVRFNERPGTSPIHAATRRTGPPTRLQPNSDHRNTNKPQDRSP